MAIPKTLADRGLRSRFNTAAQEVLDELDSGRRVYLDAAGAPTKNSNTYREGIRLYKNGEENSGLDESYFRNEVLKRTKRFLDADHKRATTDPKFAKRLGLVEQAQERLQLLEDIHKGKKTATLKEEWMQEALQGLREDVSNSYAPRLQELKDALAEQTITQQQDHAPAPQAAPLFVPSQNPLLRRQQQEPSVEGGENPKQDTLTKRKHNRPHDGRIKLPIYKGNGSLTEEGDAHAVPNDKKTLKEALKQEELKSDEKKTSSVDSTSRIQLSESYPDHTTIIVPSGLPLPGKQPKVRGNPGGNSIA